MTEFEIIDYADELIDSDMTYLTTNFHTMINLINDKFSKDCFNFITKTYYNRELVTNTLFTTNTYLKNNSSPSPFSKLMNIFIYCISLFISILISILFTYIIQSLMTNLVYPSSPFQANINYL